MCVCGQNWSNLGTYKYWSFNWEKYGRTWPAFEQIDPVNAESLGKWLVDNFMFDHFKKYSSTIPSSHKNGGYPHFFHYIYICLPFVWGNCLKGLSCFRPGVSVVNPNDLVYHHAVYEVCLSCSFQFSGNHDFVKLYVQVQDTQFMHHRYMEECMRNISAAKHLVLPLARGAFWHSWEAG